MNARELLSELSSLGARLKLGEGNRLSVEAPKGRLPESLLQHIREHKPALIDWLARSGRAAGLVLPSIEPDNENLYEPFAAADLQTAFLMGESEDMEFHVRPHYYIELEFENLDAARYEKALNAALYRHRKSLPTANGDMQLTILPTFTPVQVEVQDLRRLPVTEVEAELQQTRKVMSRQTLPLDRWPWLECRISLYGNSNARVHFNNNNVFVDGYGTQKLLSDALHYYHHPDQPLPDLTLSFRDCAIALAKLEASPQGLASQQYWIDRLPHLPSPPHIPLLASENSRTRSMLKRREAVIPADVWASLKRRAANYGLTPTNVLYAIYAEVISYWSGSRHFLLNNMVSHRFPFHPEVKEIIGNFASLYPLEVDWRVPERFYQRARRLQDRALTDLQHVYWSGVKVLQALNRMQKTPGRAPCPFVIGSGLFLRPYEKLYFGSLETPQTLLDHQFWELTDGALWFAWDLIEGFFPEGMMDAMWKAYRGLLTRLAEDEHAWSEEAFDLLPADQRRQRAMINGLPPESPFPDVTASQPVDMSAEVHVQPSSLVNAEKGPNGLLHESLTRYATRSPEKNAVITQHQSFTFKTLYQYAGRIARRLLNGGARPQELVALILNKGWWQVVAVFGVLTAGAAYVPIDPEWPEERRRLLLSTTGAKQVITTKEFRERLHLPDDLNVLCVDDICRSQESVDEESGSIGPIAKPQDLAYVIFTSGSTGTPKGVMVDHRAALNTIIDINRRFGISEKDVVFGISSLYFDLSVYDLFGTMAAGATLFMPNAEDMSSPTAWIDAIRMHSITVWNSVPALMQLLVDAALSAGVQLPSLSVVMLSGDWIPVSLPPQIRKIAPNARVISLGGATEASIWSIHFPIDEYDSNWVSVPYGKPLSNQMWRVLNDQGYDAPTWTPGNLCIGGVGLAQGYWQDEEKTERAFAPHPRTGERLYRTGDIGRYLPDGNIEFLGRSDSQVKIQGFRVEPGEIEYTLLTHPQVRAAAVITADSPRGKRLLAFVVPNAGAVVSVPGGQLSSENLRTFLRSKLPRHMVPDQVTLLEQLPLTRNGKIDRAALTALCEEAVHSTRTYTAPNTTEERALAAIWEDVLEVPSIGIHDDFFDLGGQSFAAIMVMTRVAQESGKRLPLNALFEGRTIASLAQLLHQSKAWSPLVPLHVAENNVPPCFFVHPAGGHVLAYRQLAENLGRTSYGLQAAGLSGEDAPLESIEAMATRYLQAIRKVWHGPYSLGGWSSGGVIAFEMARQLESEGQTVERVMMFDAPSPLQHDPVDDATMLAWFIEDLNIGAEIGNIDLPALVNRNKTPSEQLAAALPIINKSQMLDVEFDQKQMEPIYAVFHNVVNACRRYHPASNIRAPIVVLRAKEGSVSEFVGHPADREPDWGWSSFTRGGTASVTVPGNHHTMLSTQYSDALVRQLKRFL